MRDGEEKESREEHVASNNEETEVWGGGHFIGNATGETKCAVTLKHIQARDLRSDSLVRVPSLPPEPHGQRKYQVRCGLWEANASLCILTLSVAKEGSP